MPSTIDVQRKVDQMNQDQIPDGQIPDGQIPDGRANDDAESPPSAIARNLGLIKLAAVIMGIMIIVLLAVIIGTIATRLSKMAEPPAEMSIELPAGIELRSASITDDGMTLVVDGPEGTQIWHLSPTGERERTITVTGQ